MKIVIDLINKGDYQEALHLLLQMEGEYLYKFHCLFELEKYDEIIFLFDEKQKLIDHNYDEIIGYYILALIKLKRYSLAIDIINNELDKLNIDDIKYDNYRNLLVSIYDKATFENKNSIKKLLNKEKVAYYLLNDSYAFQVNIIDQLALIDVIDYLDIIKEYLSNDYSSILKAQLLMILVKQKITEEITVNKNGMEFIIYPHLLDLEDFDNIVCSAIDIFTARINNDDFLELCINLFVEYSYIIYPNIVDENDLFYILASIESYIYSLNDEELLDDFEECYGYDMLLISDGLIELSNLFNIEEQYKL
ncbi:MAG: hypothetical protein LBT75_03090 [Bacilli bacterium]|jgi:hypothetical protein|nr:hypothetical protein [Bacilli bacterium]